MRGTELRLAQALQLARQPLRHSLLPAAAAAACTAPAFRAAALCEAARKASAVAPRPVLSVFTPRSLAWTMVRAALLQGIPLVERYLAALEEQEELEAQNVAAPPVAFPDLGPAAVRARDTVARDLCVQLTRRCAERLVARHQPPRVTYKLLKDVYKSARRKALRPAFALLPCYERAARLARTALRAQLVPCACELLVQQLAALAEALLRLRRGGRLQPRLLARQGTYNTVAAAARTGGASAGVAAFALLIPAEHPRLSAVAALAGALAGDLAGSTIVSLLLEDWVRTARLGDGGRGPVP